MIALMDCLLRTTLHLSHWSSAVALVHVLPDHETRRNRTFDWYGIGEKKRPQSTNNRGHFTVRPQSPQFLVRFGIATHGRGKVEANRFDKTEFPLDLKMLSRKDINLYLVDLTVHLDILGYSIVLPIMASLSESLGGTLDHTTALFSCYAITQFFSTISLTVFI